MGKCLEKADKILLSQAVFTGLESDVIKGGVAIKANKIIAVGSYEDVMAYKTENTVVEDFGRQMLLSGFCDSHIHLLLGCLFNTKPNLGEATSAEDVALRLKAVYDLEKADYEPDEWVLGWNWYNFWWQGDTSFPTKAVLDKYFPERPVFLLNGDGHAAWVNSKALEICGVTKATPEIAHGQIFRDEQGEPTGYLAENAMSLCIKQAYSLPKAKEAELIKGALSVFKEAGITSVNDMQFFFGTNMGNVEVYDELAKSGDLTLRINFANGLLDDFAYTQELHQRFTEGLVQHNGVKEFIDGIITTHTGLMLDNYADDADADPVFTLMDLDAAAKQIKVCQKAGINVQLHATGDGAVRKAIDFYEAAIKENGFTKSRLSIEHLDLTDPSDWSRLGEYGIIASVQPPHITLSDSLATNDYPDVVGAEKTKNLWAFKSMLANGAKLAFGTDYPIVPINPMVGLHRAVTRLFPDGGPEGGWNPEQKLDLATALKAYTLGGAYKDGKEAILGTLEPGKLADIVVVNKNLFAIPADEILDCNVVMTMVDGKEVYHR